jgi:hypothetical protein
MCPLKLMGETSISRRESCFVEIDLTVVDLYVKNCNGRLKRSSRARYRLRY